MDPLTQGVLGGIVAQTLANKNVARKALFCGIVGGLAPDLDILIRLPSDPLVSMIYHRHFTHSLAFIPIGGLIVALFLHLVFLKDKLPFKATYIFTTLGYATHGLLDASTAYGTVLYWPFTDKRIAWDLISIIDPLFTIPLLLFVMFSSIKKSSTAARIGLFLGLAYLGLGFTQQSIAKSHIETLAAKRNHNIERIRIMPSMANLILWRSVYEYNSEFYIDAVYLAPSKEALVFEGESIEKLDIEKSFPYISDVKRKDIELFTHFADGYVGLHPQNPNVIGDFRYGQKPHSIIPIWGININPVESNEHVERIRFIPNREKLFEELWATINGIYYDTTYR